MVTGGASGIGAAVVAAAGGGRRAGGRARHRAGRRRRPAAGLERRSRPTSATTRPRSRGRSESLPGRLDVRRRRRRHRAALAAHRRARSRRVGRGVPGQRPRRRRDAAARAPLLHEGAAVVVIASLNAWRGDPNLASYIASKHALLGLVRSAALELGRRGIRVNAVGPGPVATEALLQRIDRRAADGGLPGRRARGGRRSDRARADRDRRGGGERSLFLASRPRAASRGSCSRSMRHALNRREERAG